MKVQAIIETETAKFTATANIDLTPEMSHFDADEVTAMMTGQDDDGIYTIVHEAFCYDYQVARVAFDGTHLRVGITHKRYGKDFVLCVAFTPTDCLDVPAEEIASLNQKELKELAKEAITEFLSIVPVI